MGSSLAKRLECTKRGGGRRRQFDEAIGAVAPKINGYRSAGTHDIRNLAQCLNDAGIPAPSGGPFTYGTMRRVLLRMAELQLGPGPRTLARAAAQRPPRPYKFRPVKPKGLTPTWRKLMADKGFQFE
jgi:hypothetical protein